MTAFALTLPRARRSFIAIPRRDLALDYGDSLTLALSVVESDHPDAGPVDIAGLGFRLRLSIATDYSPVRDYGCPRLGPALWSTLATIAAGADGQATITIPRGTSNRWQGRMGWSVQLEQFDDVSLLAYGALHLRQGPVLAPYGYVITDSGDAGVTDDIGQEIGSNG